MTRINSIIGAGVLGLVGFLMFIVIIFNLLAGIVGGIWLLILGHWRIVLGGFFASLTMPWWWTIVSLPSLGLAALLIFFHNKNSKLGVGFIGLIVGLFDSFLIVGWITAVFVFFLLIYLESDISIFPILLYSYSVATSPLLYMASKEPPDSPNTNLTMFIVVIGAIFFVILSLIGLPLIYPLIIMALLMVIRTLLMITLAVSEIPKKREGNFSDIRYEDEEVLDQQSLFESEDE